jgi:hypothetical protein
MSTGRNSSPLKCAGESILAETEELAKEVAEKQ